MTSAPSAPRANSAHMNPNRSWPGVPNRYSFTESSIATLPKSSATVVVVLVGTASVRSTTALAEVIAASVVSAGSSEMALTAVVLPTPKPPATSSLTGVGGRRRWVAGAAYSGDGLETTDHLPDRFEVGRR